MREKSRVAQESGANMGYLVNRTARLMAQSLSLRLQRHGVQVAQWAVLLFLYERDGQSQAELARVVAVEQPTMVRTLDRMVRDGLVTREPDATDRRVTRIRLTDRARALEQSLYAESIEANRVASSALSAAGRAQLIDSLHRIIETLLPVVSQNRDASGGGQHREPGRDSRIEARRQPRQRSARAGATTKERKR